MIVVDQDQEELERELKNYKANFGKEQNKLFAAMIIKKEETA